MQGPAASERGWGRACWACGCLAPPPHARPRVPWCLLPVEGSGRSGAGRDGASLRAPGYVVGKS